jgi:hypothetical protein
MSPERTLRVLHGWETVRYELMRSRICDLGLRIEGSPVEVFVDRLHGEMAARGLVFCPEVYPTDSWGCPDEVPVIGVPFYLTDKRLARIEEEQTGEIEGPRQIMMLLRHEAGHAVNYAYRLYRQPAWRETFGPFDRPYRDAFRPDPSSRAFVRHLDHHRYGRTYAQKHPDEDFAETFAVWLTPRSGWRRRYRYWTARHKLEYVDKLMRSLRGVEPMCTSGPLCTPADGMDVLLADHYGQRAEQYRAAAQGYVDDKLREVFPQPTAKRDARRPVLAAADLIREHLGALAARVARWSGLDEAEVGVILSKLEDRARALGLLLPRSQQGSRLLDVTSLATALAMDFAYTGRLTG